MTVPDLRALQQGETEAWDQAFAWLWPTAWEVVQLKLRPFLPGEVEDVAIEVLEDVIEKVRSVKEVEELKPLTASIAHNRAVSRLRQQFAAKRGAGQTGSLEPIQSDEGCHAAPASGQSPLDSLNQLELADLLQGLLAQLKPQHKAVLIDFHLNGLTYEQIAQKHGMPQGTIGVYLKRGLEAIRRATEKNPTLLKELEAFLRCLLWL